MANLLEINAKFKRVINIWFFTHGIATMIATNSYDLCEHEVEEYVAFAFSAMKEKIKNEKA